MATILAKSPTELLWWEWCKLAGVVVLVVLLLLGITGYMPHSTIVALCLHWVLDFTLQSPEIAARKGERGRHLLIHALITGGLPGIIAGGLPGLIVGIISHYAIDYTDKFGLPMPWGIIVDQVLHILAIVV